MDNTLEVPTVDVRKRIPTEVIHELARRIGEQFRLQRVILFGSYAHGQPRPESDVDLLVIIETPLRETEQALEIRPYLNPLFGLDLLVYTPARMEERLARGTRFCARSSSGASSCMNPLTAEWVQKAEGDFATAGREVRVRVAPNYDAVCFHAQLTAEKYLKAILQESGQPIRPTHSLADLLALCLSLDPAHRRQPSVEAGVEGHGAAVSLPVSPQRSPPP